MGEKAISAELRNEFDNLYRASQQSDQWWKKLFRTIRAGGAYEIFHGYNAVPIPQAWMRGNSLAEKGFDEFHKTIYVYDYELTLTWHENDENDSRAAESLMSRVRDGAVRLAGWDELALLDLMQGSATYLHPSTDFTAYDSLPLYSSSHAMRSGGNIVSGSGVSTAEDIKSDWFDVLQAFREMVNGEGEMYWRDALDRARFLLVVPPHLEDVMREACSDDGESRVDLVVWERLSRANNDWYVFLSPQGEQRPFIKLDRMAVRHRTWDFDNSEWSNKTKMKGMGFDVRAGYGVLNTHTAIQVAN